MNGAPTRVLHELAGHQSLAMTERYVHLAPTAKRGAIDLLRRPAGWRHERRRGNRCVNI